MDEDWDLHAIVRTFTNTAVKTTATTIQNTIENTVQDPFANPAGSVPPFVKHEEDDPFCFPDLYKPKNTNPFEELEQFLNPFFPTTNHIHMPPSSSISNLGGNSDPKPHIHFHDHHQQFQRPKSGHAVTLASRSRRRKNQQKRVVQQVTAESLSSDMWAWRKYGQKPIKGSPYPRNYYRCSSSKGCSARKQVERSNSDPDTFVITYTGEHTHPRPTHRNSLAGSTRNKCSTTSTAATAISSDNNPQKHENNQQATTNFPSPISSSYLSPTTPLMTPLMDYEDPEKNQIVQEKDGFYGDNDDDDDDEFLNDQEELDEAELLIPNMAMNEDILMGLQRLGQGVKLSPPPPPPWTPPPTPTPAAAESPGK